MNAVPKPAEQSLYAAREKVYPREVSGRFDKLRTLALVVLLGTFYGLPWLQWNGRQALLFDLPARKFYIFGLTFFPQDFFLLTWLLVIAALSLFFVTALAGRLWCGYACPQTVWTSAFLYMEQWIEGNRQQRMKLDKAPWTWNKLWRKTAKQMLWIGFSLYTGLTFVGYFTAIRTLPHEIATFTLGGWEMFWIGFYSFATYGNAGFLREQVCKYMCPYARFQGAMFDRNTLIISYDTKRGEPRGARARQVDTQAAGLGDCIDCTMCVQVCPTGIDIRKGLQLECIACAACIDVCDGVMDRMQYPRGLIRYSTQASMEGSKPRILRPRTFIYGSLLLVLIAGFATAIVGREILVVDVLRDRNALYRQIDESTIENVYTVRVINKDTRAHELKLSVRGLPGISIEADAPTQLVDAEDVRTIAVRVRAGAADVAGGHDIEIVVTDVNDSTRSGVSRTRFIAPVRK